MNETALAPVTGGQVQTTRKEREIEFKPFGSDDSIKLSAAIIRNYVAVPAQNDRGEIFYPTDAECTRFLMRCQAQRLNPFSDDASMVPFWDKKLGGYKWALITQIAALYKRAEVHPKYDGMLSGVIVEDDNGDIQYVEGDFYVDGWKLLGGWAEVSVKDRKNPTRKRVKLSSYQKQFGQWLNDPGGMICKVAEAHALRDTFPTLCGGMYLREEFTDIEAQVIATTGESERQLRRPDFGKGLPAPDIEAIATRKPSNPAKSAGPPAGNAPGAAQTPPPSQGSTQATNAAPASNAQQSTPEKSETTPARNGLDGPVEAQERRLAEAEAESQTEPEPEDPGNPEDKQPGEPPEPAAIPLADGLQQETGDTDAVASVKMLAAKAGVPWSQLRNWLIAKRLMKPEQRKLNEISSSKVEALNRTFSQKLPEIRSTPIK